LSEDEFKNLTQLYDQNDSAPNAIKNPLVLAVENYPFVDRNVAGLGFQNDDGETIDLGQVQKSEFFIKGTQALERQQQQNPDQPLTSSEIDRTLKQAELATQATTNGPGINDNTLNKILKSSNVIVNAVDDTQRSPDVFDDRPFFGDIGQPTLLGGAGNDTLEGNQKTVAGVPREEFLRSMGVTETDQTIGVDPEEKNNTNEEVSKNEEEAIKNSEDDKNVLFGTLMGSPVATLKVIDLSYYKDKITIEQFVQLKNQVKNAKGIVTTTIPDDIRKKWNSDFEELGEHVNGLSLILPVWLNVDGSVVWILGLLWRNGGER